MILLIKFRSKTTRIYNSTEDKAVLSLTLVWVFEQMKLKKNIDIRFDRLYKSNVLFSFLSTKINCLKMLQRLLQIRFDAKISSMHTNILFRLPFQNPSCHCGVRLYSGRKIIWLRTAAEATTFKNRISCVKARCFASHKDALKKETSIDTLNNKGTLAAAKKINVKLKTSDLKRLFNLAAPEKWNLTGKYRDGLL